MIPNSILQIDESAHVLFTDAYVLDYRQWICWSHGHATLKQNIQCHWWITLEPKASTPQGYESQLLDKEGTVACDETVRKIQWKKWRLLSLLRGKNYSIINQSCHFCYILVSKWVCFTVMTERWSWNTKTTLGDRRSPWLLRGNLWGGFSTPTIWRARVELEAGDGLTR